MLQKKVLDLVVPEYNWEQKIDDVKTYKADIEYFKNKWLKPTASELAKSEIDKSILEVKEELYKALGVSKDV